MQSAWLHRERTDGSFAGRMSSRVLGRALIGRRRQHSNRDMLQQSRCQTSPNHEGRLCAAVTLSLAPLCTLGRSVPALSPRDLTTQHDMLPALHTRRPQNGLAATFRRRR
jgi:hypothetical protein